MSRRFWCGALIVSLLVTSAAAFYVVTQVQNKEIVSMMTVETMQTGTAQMPEAKPAAPATTAAPAPPPQSEATPAVNTSEEKKEPLVKRNILFSLPRPNAQSVFIVGDFNDWQEDVMTKKDKKWQRTVALEPGTYKYMFVVDKKQIRDPNNKLSSDGKSLITVKPLTPSK